MNRDCSDACTRLAEIRMDQESRLPKSVFELELKTLGGTPFSFSDLQGKVTVIVNVASYCGYTESHYKGLVELWSQLEGNDSVQILAFPCNQFGKQEPGSAAEIAKFVADKGVEFTMMEKVDVNGPNTSLLYLYLKHKTGVSTIGWNFATYFIIGPTGDVTAHSGVEPLGLKDSIFELLGKEEL